MKTKYYIILITLLFLIRPILFAHEVHLKKAKKIAKNLYYERYRQFSNIKYEDIKITNDFTITNKDKAIYYVFNISDNKGFVIISADDNAYPILAYSFKNNYIKNDQPPAFSELMENYKKQIVFIKENDLHSTSKIKREWQHYSSNQFKPDLNNRGIEPLVTTTWDQDCFYDDSCPLDPSGACGHARVGCVATAMAQVMRYNNYPQQGTGSHGYYSPYGYLFVNFGAATYNWDNMPDYLTDTNPDVARLCYHCGVSVDMNYGPEGSGAYSQDVAIALVNYFNYASSTHLVYKSSYSTNDWEALLRNELDSLRPMYYSGSGSGGHAFVCDGYQENNHFHFNWGWGGLYNGYYYVSNLNPGTHNYSNNQAAVIGIKCPLPPIADFTANTTTVLNGSSVSFTDLSEHIPNSWQWTFQGGYPGISNEKNPSNIYYVTTGTYTVSLTVTNANGSHDTTKTNYITVSPYALPVADFKVSDTIAKTGISKIKFTDLSLNNPNAWKWSFVPNSVSFVDGTNPHSKNPHVKFNKAVKYTATLIAANNNGSDTLTKPDLILSGGKSLPFIENFEQGSFKDYWTIENPDEGITWDGYYKLSGNLPSRRAAWINFYQYSAIGERDRLISPLINLYGHNNATLEFKHAYAIYDESRKDSLIVYISTNCGASWTRILECGEDGTGSFATHPPKTSEFVPSVPADWCGNAYGSCCYTIDLTPWAQSPNVKIMFESYNGHGNSLYVDDVIIYDPGVYSDFTANPTDFCDQGYVNFTDQSIGNPTSWQWIFDGAAPGTSNEQNPDNIFYDTPGNYDVTLIVNKYSYSDTLTKKTYIKDHTIPSKPAVPTGQTSLCENSSNTLYVTPGANFATSYQWTLYPDSAGEISGLDKLGVVNWNDNYFGQAEIKVKGISMCGEGEYSDPLIITIYPPPIADAGNDTTICAGDCITLHAAGGETYLWNTSDTTENIEVCPTDTTTYFVTVTDSNACSNQDSVTVNVNPLPLVNLGNDTTICVNQSITLHAGQGFNSYLWSDGSTDSILTVDSTGIGIGCAIFWVQVTNSYECPARDSITITFDPCTGIVNNKNNLEINLFPNPNNGTFKIELLSAKNDIINIKIINSLGLVVYEKSKIHINKYYSKTIDLSDFPDDIYCLFIQNNKMNIFKKIIIKK